MGRERGASVVSGVFVGFHGLEFALRYPEHFIKAKSRDGRID